MFRLVSVLTFLSVRTRPPDTTSKSDNYTKFLGLGKSLRINGITGMFILNTFKQVMTLKRIIIA